MALTPSRESWWRRNRLWLALLVPLLAAAIASSSWAYFTLYRPQQYHRVQPAVDGRVHFVQHTRSTGYDYTIDTTMQLISFAPVTGNDWSVPSGQQLWRSTMRFEADPQTLLNGCRLSLVDQHGRKYAPNLGVKSESSRARTTVMEMECTPSGKSGPVLIMGKVLPPSSGSERPGTWEISQLWALPNDVTPTRLRVAWSAPDYAEFTIPAR